MLYHILHIYINTTTTAYSHTFLHDYVRIISLKSIYENWSTDSSTASLECLALLDCTGEDWSGVSRAGRGRRQEAGEKPGGGNSDTQQPRSSSEEGLLWSRVHTVSLHCWGAKMKLKTVSILLAACYVKINSCENSLEEYLGPDSKSGDLR